MMGGAIVLIRRASERKSCAVAADFF